MTARTTLALMAILVAVKSAQAQTPNPSPVQSDSLNSERLWVEAEFLLWWMRGDRVPPLVTGSPPGAPIGQAGVLGVPGTVVLFGGERTNSDARSGGRLTIGVWLDDEHD